MSLKQDGYLAHLLSVFRPEAQEHIDTMSNGLMSLEKATAPGEVAPLVELIYREAHSLKGAARAVDMADVEGLCQRLENVFALMKRGDLTPTPELLDLLHRALTALSLLLMDDRPSISWRDLASEIDRAAERMGRKNNREEGYELAEWERPTPAPAAPAAPQPPPAPQPAPAPRQAGNGQGETKAVTVGNPLRPRGGIGTGPLRDPSTLPGAPQAPAAPQRLVEAPEPLAPAARDGGAETIRVSTAKLDMLLLQAEELLSAKLTITHRSQELRELSSKLNVWSKELARVQSDMRAMQHLAEREERGEPFQRQRPLHNVLEFLELSRSFHQSFATEIGAVSRAADGDQAGLATLADALLDGMKKVLMLPFAAFTEILPKMVRDVSRDCGKRVDFSVQGGDVEIDRRILEGLKDPLIHLLRNAVDHGIETPEARQAAGKPENGQLKLAIVQKDANKVEVVVSDDGGGIDVDRVKSAAARSGQMVSEGLDDSSALALIFASGVSTSPMITELSGRGLGMAIVREKVEKLGGTVTVESKHGAGTTFRLLLPLTMATCRAVLLRVGDRLFVLPTTHVERVVGISSADVKMVSGRETIVLEGRVIPLARIHDALGLAPSNEGRPDHPRPAVVLGIGDKLTAFMVDAVLGEQEILVKNLGQQLVRVGNFSGATVLGNGKVVPILSAADLMKSAASSRRPAAHDTRQPAARQKSILVAEDSITSRTLLKNILETAGYRVRTAIDGVDALTALRSESTDLLLSDVEMPRMNGFELTARVRADNNLKDLPVVLVTSLESREDRERGVEAGANAYMVKRGFDGGSLLDVIGRLL